MHAGKQITMIHCQKHEINDSCNRNLCIDIYALIIFEKLNSMLHRIRYLKKGYLNNSAIFGFMEKNMIVNI